MKKLACFMGFMVCLLLMGGCGQESGTTSNSGAKPTVLTVEERKDIFVSYFNYSTAYIVSDIERNLDKIPSPMVLTLDEALEVFWVESGVLPKDYLRKTDENGQVYYHHKNNDNKISVFVNLLYGNLDYAIADSDNPDTYGFLVIQTDGPDFLIKVSGETIILE